MRMLSRLKNRFIRLIEEYRLSLELKELIGRLQTDQRNKRAIIFQLPAHSNIGDHAIAQAEIDFLASYFSTHELIEINQSLHFSFLKRGKKLLKSSDIIFLHGGGNFGNQYMFEEEIRRSTLEAFPDNKIIIFPQTIFYSDDLEGGNCLKETAKLIEGHADLTLIAREVPSFELMKEYFVNPRILLVPDIVLSMNLVSPKLSRSGILMVLRSDEERVLSEENHANLDLLVRKFSDTIIYSDMHYHRDVRNINGREAVLNYKFSQFKKTKLVITDRLHGMVFAAITQTPCIAFSNYNQKVSGTFEWIKHLNYVRYVDSSVNIEEKIEKLMNLGELDDFDPAIYMQYYQQIVDVVNE